jgi:hypothetical protein
MPLDINSCDPDGLCGPSGVFVAVTCLVNYLQ